MLHLQVNEGQYLGMVSIRDVVSSCTFFCISCTFPVLCFCVLPAHDSVLMHWLCSRPLMAKLLTYVVIAADVQEHV